MSAESYSGENKTAYQLAKKYSETLKKVRCHCGCMQNHGHKSLHTCFETSHGSHCTECKAEVLRVSELKKQHKTDEEISKQIDKEFESEF